MKDVLKDLFLCHTGADKDWVRHLGERLEAERINGRPMAVWFDEWDVDFGENIVAKIDEGLRMSRFVGVVLSPAMVRAEWPNAEWQSQIMDDPTGKKGRILPILRHKFDPETGEPIDLPFALKPLKRLDFTQDKNFETELAKLLHRLSGQRPARGGRGGLGSALASLATAGQAAPDAVEESLPSNLFPVLEMPELLYGDAATVSDRRDVWKALKGKQIPPFLVHGGHLYSFYSPADEANPFMPFLAKTDPRPEQVRKWLADTDRARQLVGMLNDALHEHCFQLRIRSPKDDRSHFYCPIFDGKPRTFRWGAGQRVRTLAIMKERQDGSPFGVHMSAYMRFILLGDRLFLLVEPAWLFTTDGVSPLAGKEVGRFSTLWGGRERNASVLRNVLMWGLLLAKGQACIEVSVGPAVVSLQSVPAHTKTNAGIAGDAIRLDRILGGDGAGEQIPEEDRDDGTKELELVAALAIVGAAAVPDARDVERVMLERTEESSDEPELPF